MVTSAWTKQSLHRQIAQAGCVNAAIPGEVGVSNAEDASFSSFLVISIIPLHLAHKAKSIKTQK